MMKSIRATVFLLALLGAAPPAAAQDRPPQFLNLIEIKVKLSQMPQWQAYVHKVIEAAQKTGAAQHWMMLELVQGGEAGTFFAAVPFNDLGDLDSFKAPPLLVLEAFGAEEGWKILGPGLEATESVNLETYSLLEEFTTHFDASRYAADFYRVIRTQVKPHMNRTYRSLLARGSALARQRPDGPMTLRRSIMMGTSFRYLAATPFASWGTAGGDDLSDLMREEWGEEATREFFDTLNRCIEKRETIAIALRRDLSRLPE